MRGDRRLISVQYKNGSVARIPRGKASELLDQKKIKLICKSLFRGLNAGLEKSQLFDNNGDLLPNHIIRKKINNIKNKSSKKQEKGDKKRQRQRRNKKDKLDVDS